MHFYSMGRDEVLSLPVRTFWCLHRNIDRIKAEENRGLFVAMASKESGEAAEEYMKTTGDIIGQIFYLDVDAIQSLEALDEVGLASIADLGRL